MKARAGERFELGESIREPSHVLAFGGARAVVVSRYGRCIVRIDRGQPELLALEPLARTPRDGPVDLGRRGAPFRWGEGFGVAYADVLHLWPTFESASMSLPVSLAEAALRRERGRLEPLLACETGPCAALVALHAGAASVHAAHRLVRMEWDEVGANWRAGDLYLDPRRIAGFEAAGDGASDPHPPAIGAIRCRGRHTLLHSTGSSRNHARYGMEYSVLAVLDERGRTEAIQGLPDGYALFGDDRILVQALRSRSGGLDFSCLDLEGRPCGELRVTRKAMAPVEDSWLVAALGGRDLWLGDGEGRLVRFEIEDE